MSDILLRGITVDSGNLTVRNGTVQVTNTTPSTLLTGSLVVNGGISISTTEDATSISSGGGVTVAGGLSTLKSVIIGSNLDLSSPMGTMAVEGVSERRFFVDTTVQKKITFSPDGVNLAMKVLPDTVAIYSTADSTGSSTGALVIGGGLGVAKDICVGGDINVSGYTYAYGSIYLDTTGILSTSTSGVSLSSPVGIVIDSDKLSVQDKMNISDTGVDVYTTMTLHDTTWSSGSTGSVVISGGLTVLCTTDSFSPSQGGAVTILGGLGVLKNVDVLGSVKVNTNNDNTSKLILHSQANIGTTNGNIVCISDEHIFMHPSSTRPSAKFTTTGLVLGETCTLVSNTTGLTITSSQSNTLLHVGDMTLGYLGHTNVVSSGNDLVIQNELIVTTSGNVHVQSQFTCDGNVYFTDTTNATSSTEGGAVDVLGGIGIAKDTYIGGKVVLGDVCTLDLFNDNLLISTNEDTGVKVFSNGGLVSPRDVDLELFTLGFDRGNTNYSTLRITGAGSGVNWAISSDSDGTGSRMRIDLQTSTTASVTVSTMGNVGINTTSPDATLDVNGTLRCNGPVSCVDTTVSTISAGALSVTGGVTVHCTTNATGLSSGGGVTVQGGVSVNKDAYFGGVVTFTDSTPSTSYLTGAVNIRGGLTISGNAPAGNVGNGGALTVAGGASIGGDLWVGGGINGSGSSSSSYAYLTLTATDESVNFTSGALVTFGGITIQCSTDSTSVTNGGSLLVRGGASFGGGVYIEGDNFLYGTQNYVTKYSSTIFNVYDNLRFLKFSVDSNPNFSITRYDSLEQPKERSLEINSVTGELTIASPAVSVTGTTSFTCTQNASNVSSGGAVTVVGGLAISKDTYIGGDLRVVSSTESLNCSTGAVMVSGGVGIGGALNVLGNTIIGGNLTVNGTTTSIQTVDTVLKDNVILLNAGPVGSRDSGVAIQRYQMDNDAGEGDVVQHTGGQAFTLPDQTGTQTTEVKLGISASSTNDYYNGWWIRVASGFSNNQTRKVVSYNGTTRVAGLSSAWTSQNPGIGDVVILYNKPYVGLTFNELSDRFEFASCATDFKTPSTDYLDVCVNKLYASVLDVSSGVSVSATSDATSSTYGGALTVLVARLLQKGCTLVGI